MLYVCLVCPSYHKAGLASLVCILCYRTGSHTEKDLVLDLMFYCHSLEVLNILLDKEACISFFFFQISHPQIMQLVVLERQVFGDTKFSITLSFRTQHQYLWHSTLLQRVGVQPDSFLYLSDIIFLPGCLKKSFFFEVQLLSFLYYGLLEHSMLLLQSADLFQRMILI